MSTDDDTRKALERYAATLRQGLDQHGFVAVPVLGDQNNPSFCYTVGLHANFRHPEIIVFGLPPDTAVGSMNEIADRIKHGEKMTPNQVYTDIFRNTRAVFHAVQSSRAADHMVIANQLYGRGMYQALQLIWPDQEGRFPWEDGFDERFRRSQPMLTE